jgi:teichoic acid transport system permease protein
VDKGPVPGAVVSGAVREVGAPAPGSSAPGSPATELAERYGLGQSGVRPSLRAYIGQLWRRRHFILAFANAKTVAMYTNARLGQVWQVLTPLMNAAVYFLIFGLLLKTRGGVENYIAFLVAGIFVFNFTQRAVLVGSRAISDNLGLIRALHFPRAALPLSLTLVELQQLLVSIVVLGTIVLVTGEPLTWSWLLLVPALLLQSLFNVGLCLAIARFGAKMTDVSQMLPFLLRAWQYSSGVFYSIEHFSRTAPEWARLILTVNPGAVYIELVRDALIESYSVDPEIWLYGIGWALAVFVAGFVYFWNAEETYGRG